MTQTPSVSWGARALRRTAWTLGSAVVLAAVGPAIANAAGAHVRNPVSVALNALSGGAPDECEAAPSASPSVEPSVEPSVDPSASVEPTSVPTVEPTVAPTPCVTPTPEPSESESPESPEPSEAPESEAPEAPESPSEAAGHGAIVSTVAQCAPKGHDPLLDVDGAPGNHGAFVNAAAHGGSLTTPWGTFDLSSQAGADALCAAIDAARAALPPAPAKTHGKHAKSAKHHGKHAE